MSYIDNVIITGLIDDEDQENISDFLTKYRFQYCQMQSGWRLESDVFITAIQNMDYQRFYLDVKEMLLKLDYHADDVQIFFKGQNESVFRVCLANELTVDFFR